jgi:hypothetical protein
MNWRAIVFLETVEYREIPLAADVAARPKKGNCGFKSLQTLFAGKKAAFDNSNRFLISCAKAGGISSL